MTHITRRDFLNGVALTIAAGLTPAAQIAAQPWRYPPALTGLRGQHEGSFETAHAQARDRGRFSVDRLPVEERYDLVVGRRRHQRAGGRLVLSPRRRAVRAHPRPRQPRRFRRSRQAQRVHSRWPAGDRLRRQRVDRFPGHELQRRGQGAAARARRRGRAVRDRLRAHALFLARALARRVLRPRGVRARPAGGRRAADAGHRRAHAPPRQRQAAARLRRRVSDLRGEQGAARRALRRRRAIRSPAAPSRPSSSCSSAPATATIS